MSFFQDEIQTSASSCDETELQTSSQEQAEREPGDHVTKTRGRRKTVHRSPDSQANGNVQTEKKLPPVPNLVYYQGAFSYSLMISGDGKRCPELRPKSGFIITPQGLALRKYLLSTTHRDFSGGPVARTPCFHCQGPRFSPWLGN